MTVQEAKLFFGLREDDSIYKEGVLEIMEYHLKRLKVWSLSKYDRQECKQTVEACKALLEGDKSSESKSGNQ